VRIANEDADAIGKEAEASQAEKLTTAEGSADLEELVWDQLKTCFDPEIPVNIVDLGLVYQCQVTPLPEGEKKFPGSRKGLRAITFGLKGKISK